MSGQALVWAANVRGLKPATKIVLIQLAERHNKDTGRCDPSIKTLADDCEMDRTTVLRHLEILEALGLLDREKRGNEDGGRASNAYILHMPETVITDVSGGVKSQITTGVKSQFEGGLSRNFGGVKSHSCATRTCKEPGIEPSFFGSDEPQKCAHDLFSENPTVEQKPKDRFDEFWMAYPKKAGKPAAQKAWAKAIKRADPQAIIDGARRYARSDAVERGFAKHPQGWLSDDRWADTDLPPLPVAGAPSSRVRQNWGEVVR